MEGNEEKSHKFDLYINEKHSFEDLFCSLYTPVAGETAHSPAWAGSPGSKLEVGRGFITFPSGSIKNISLNTSSFTPIL